jgi:hypothetical protein
MLQFFFLSVFANLLAGASLASEYLGQKLPFFAPIKDLLTKRGSKIAIGFAAVAVGIVKLIIRSPGRAVPVAGDLLPALAGIGMGMALLVDFFKQKVAQPSEALEKAEKIAMTYRLPVGIAGLAIAVLHFIFPGTIIL